MKICASLASVIFAANLAAAEIPKVFSGLFEPDVPVKGQIGVVMPPPEIDKLVAKVETAARKDPKWFREFSAQSKPGIPLPFDERLGLTKTEYDDYLALWSKREFKPREEVVLTLRKSSADTWSLFATVGASSLTTLRYNAKTDTFRSPSGELKRADDIKADATSILGEWSGLEWKFEEETVLGKMKENVALGRFSGNAYGVVIYRAQETSTEGSRLLDSSLVVRFPITASSAAKNPEPAAKPAPKPTPKPASKNTKKN
jgi:hypothetical protein